jgi:hypothetical protein
VVSVTDPYGRILGFLDRNNNNNNNNTSATISTSTSTSTSSLCIQGYLFFIRFSVAVCIFNLKIFQKYNCKYCQNVSLLRIHGHPSHIYACLCYVQTIFMQYGRFSSFLLSSSNLICDYAVLSPFSSIFPYRLDSALLPNILIVNMIGPCFSHCLP